MVDANDETWQKLLALPDMDVDSSAEWSEGPSAAAGGAGSKRRRVGTFTCTRNPQLTLNVSKEEGVVVILHCHVCLSHSHTLVACFVPTNTTQNIENRGVPTDGRKCLKSPTDRRFG